jgi:hypothetical protein
MASPKSAPATLSAAAFERVRDKLYDELVLLDEAWAEALFLFGSDKERLRMLNACAGRFFAYVQRLLIREVILSVSRLTDEPSVGKHKNLTISVLLSDPALVGHRKERAEIRRRINNAKRAAGALRLHRHAYIAHLDHELVAKRTNRRLPALPSLNITKVIRALEDAYDYHGQVCRNTSTSFELDSLSSAHALMAILESSERWRKYREIVDRPGASDAT